MIHCLPPSVLGRLLGHRRHLFKPDTVFLDLNYGTRAEPVRTAVTCHGITYVDGLPMLAKQAVESFEYWTGYAVSTTLLEQLLLEIAEIQPG